MDTLVSVNLSIDKPDGIRTVYQQSLQQYTVWGQPSVYNKIRNYELRDLTFFDELKEVNADEENYDFFRGYKPNENSLPHDAWFYKNKNYKTPEELIGTCPYLRYDHKIRESVRMNIKKMVDSKLEEEGYKFLKILSVLSFRKDT